MNIHCRLIFFSAAFLISIPSAFGLTLPHVFGDHMVLQSGQPVRDHLVFHIGGMQGPLAIRQGAWKFIQPGKGGYGQAAKGEGSTLGPAGQLYHLGDDWGETKNLVAEQPEKAQGMQALLQEIRAYPRSRP